MLKFGLDSVSNTVEKIKEKRDTNMHFRMITAKEG
jgi:hypothetical protein